MLVEPSELDDVICVTEAMRPNWRSSGVATADAIVSGLAPGRLELTEIVGKSTCGRGATGSSRKPIAPDRQNCNRHQRRRYGTPDERGRNIRGDVHSSIARSGLFHRIADVDFLFQPPRDPIKREINHGCGVERE